MSEGRWSPVALFVGGLRPLPPEAQLTGMFKIRQDAPVFCGVEGLQGDQQGDRRVHGGPDKAVHLYPGDHYRALTQLLPDAQAALEPGALGENLSVGGIDESAVCVGDIFALGEVRLQLSQPRRPCWKISHRLGVDTASRVVAEHGLTGWYFRVLDAGMMPPDAILELLDRPAPDMPLTRLWAVELAHRPPVDEMRMLAAAPGLAEAWAQRLRQRADWVDRQAR